MLGRSESWRWKVREVNLSVGVMRDKEGHNTVPRKCGKLMESIMSHRDNYVLVQLVWAHLPAALLSAACSLTHAHRHICFSSPNHVMEYSSVHLLFMWSEVRQCQQAVWGEGQSKHWQMQSTYCHQRLLPITEASPSNTWEAQISGASIGEQRLVSLIMCMCASKEHTCTQKSFSSGQSSWKWCKKDMFIPAFFVVLSTGSVTWFRLLTDQIIYSRTSVRLAGAQGLWGWRVMRLQETLLCFPSTCSFHILPSELDSPLQSTLTGLGRIPSYTLHPPKHTKAFLYDLNPFELWLGSI